MISLLKTTIQSPNMKKECELFSGTGKVILDLCFDAHKHTSKIPSRAGEEFEAIAIVPKNKKVYFIEAESNEIVLAGNAKRDTFLVKGVNKNINRLSEKNSKSVVVYKAGVYLSTGEFIVGDDVYSENELEFYK